ncbi:hypothetical protein OAJ65_01225 [Flavobacteriales bacterium]|nr:hypothetical protein [Flavobacteriales bacterium]
MKKLIIILIFTSTITNAQNIMLEYGVATSSFIFKDDSGEKMNSLLSKDLDYGSLGYEFKGDKVKLNTSISQNNYGAKSSEHNYSWDLSYIGVNIGGIYYLSKKEKSLKKIQPTLGAGISAQFLTDGTQMIDNEVFDLKNMQDGKFNNLFMISAGVGVLYKLNNNTLLHLRSSLTRGLNNLETDGQSLHIMTYNTSISLMINLQKNKKTKN